MCSQAIADPAATNEHERGHERLLVLDFGSQYTQLIARRVRELGVFCEIEPYSLPIEEIAARRPVGIVLSGGPESVYGEAAPRSDAALLELGIPVLGICYGMQLMAQQLGGDVAGRGGREYGRAEISVCEFGHLFAGLDERQTVWMSHGDKVEALPADFGVAAATDSAPIVAFQCADRGLYAIQFHPEVSHTEHGTEILRNFLFGACQVRGDWKMSSYLAEAIEDIRAEVGDQKVLCAISGGVDSCVLAVLLREAIGSQVHGIFVDNGVLRLDEGTQVMESLAGLGVQTVAVDARQRFLQALAGIEEPEKKRKIIGRLFIEVFDEEAQKLEGIRFLAQGTLYPDVIESVSVKGPSATIKTHHNVGGLPERLGFDLVEPLRNLFKDEVRELGRQLGVPEQIVSRHPFPGPGLAVRILGEVTVERVERLQQADAIFIDELRRGGLYDQVSQAFAVLLPVHSVGVMGDLRTYENVVALRCVDTRDFMTADWSQLPPDLLSRAASRIVNDVPGINRVTYDITSKPPGTIEWE